MHFAAAANQPHPAFGKIAGHFAHIFRIHGSHEPVADALESAGIGHHHHLHRSGTDWSRVFDRIHKGACIPRRATIDSGDLRAQVCHPGDERDRVGFQMLARVGGVEGHFRDEGRSAGNRTDQGNEQFKLGQGTERLQKQRVGSDRSQGFNLFAIATFDGRSLSQGFDGGSDRSQDEDGGCNRAPGLELRDGRPRHLHARAVQVGDSAFQAEGLQLLAVGAERVGFKTARSGGEVGQMDFLNQLRLFRVERFVNVVDFRQPSCQFEQIGTHRSVG